MGDSTGLATFTGSAAFLGAGVAARTGTGAGAAAGVGAGAELVFVETGDVMNDDVLVARAIAGETEGSDEADTEPVSSETSFGGADFPAKNSPAVSAGSEDNAGG